MFRKNGFLLLMAGLFFTLAWYGGKLIDSGSGNRHLHKQLADHFESTENQLLSWKKIGVKELLATPQLHAGSETLPYSVSVQRNDSLIWWSNSNYLYSPKSDGIHELGLHYLLQKTWSEGNEVWILNIPFFNKDLLKNKLSLYPGGPQFNNAVSLSNLESPYFMATSADNDNYYLHFEDNHRPPNWLILIYLAYIISFGFGIVFFAIIIDNIISRFQYRQIGPVLLFALLLLFRVFWHYLKLSPLMEECMMQPFSDKDSLLEGKVADQIINLALLFGLLLYTFKRLQDFRFDHLPSGWRFFLAGINYFGTLTALILFTRTLKDLVEFAAFDANLVYHPSVHSFVFLFSLGLLLCLFFLISHRMAFVISRLKLPLSGKLISMGLAFALIFPFYTDLSIGFPIFLMYLASFSYLLLFDLFVEVKKPTISWLLAWLVLFSGFTSILLQRFAAMNLKNETQLLAKEFIYKEDPILKKLISTHYQPLLSKVSTISQFSKYEFLNTIFSADNYIEPYYNWKIIDDHGLTESTNIKSVIVHKPVSFSFYNDSPVTVEFTPKSFIANYTNEGRFHLPFKGLSSPNGMSFGMLQDDSLTWQLGTLDIYHLKNELSKTTNDWFSLNGKEYLIIPQSNDFSFIAERDEVTLGYKVSYFSLLFFVLVLSLVLLSILNSIVAFLPDQMYLRFAKVTSLQNKLQYAFIGLLLFSFLCIGLTSVYYFKQEHSKESTHRITEYLNNWKIDFNQNSAADSHFKRGTTDQLFSSPHLMALKFEKSNFYWPFPLFTNSLPYLPGLPHHIVRESNSIEFNANVTPIEKGKLLAAYIFNPNKTTWTGVYYSLAAPQSIRSFIGNLFNISVFLLIISIAIAIFIAKTLTAPIVRLGQRMQSTKLGRKNEPLEWNQRDELGILISQYNNMVDNLEKSAEMIAQNEREIAWREMAKQVAHEIKNPLTPMKLSIQHLETKISALSPEEVPAFVRRVSTTLIEQIDNLTRIATEFSSFSKLPEPNNEKIVLNDLVSSVHDLFRKREDIIFNLYVPIDEIYIYADRSHVLRILNNLIKNAIQAIPGENRGKMDIKLFTRKGYAIIQVSDNGSGIPKEMRDKVFFPNFTTKSSGTGLGLAICKDIVESYGGRIYFESIENKGSDFFVEFPLFEGEANEY
jgi:two-component system, NtrC family, nitrogen regulation sensor histidine kinase NtrY